MEIGDFPMMHKLMLDIERGTERRLETTKGVNAMAPSQVQLVQRWFWMQTLIRQIDIFL
jgi:hypothetical protein